VNTAEQTFPALSDDSPTPEAFLQKLIEESHRHPALTHPLLRDFGSGRLPDPAWAVRDFAWHYHGYSAWFPRYLRAVIRRLENEDHRRLLEQNLSEERGDLDPEDYAALREVGIAPESVVGIPHSVLFKRFCLATGLDAATLATPREATVRWRTKFLTLLRGASPAAAVGALGLGTESIVKRIYPPILEGIKRLRCFQRRDYVFFELHCLVDDQHQQDLFDVAASLANTERGRRDLRAGMLAALDLRREFWDVLYERATCAPRAVSA
jgi:pyrroloquinoline quinone (PQQ) biosynthesis protein C